MLSRGYDVLKMDVRWLVCDRGIEHLHGRLVQIWQAETCIDDLLGRLLHTDERSSTRCNPQRDQRPETDYRKRSPRTQRRAREYDLEKARLRS